MPSAKKVRWAQLRVGLMALVAMILLAILVFLLTGTKKLFVPKSTLYTYLDDSAALAVGAPVRLNGYLIGNVTAVELSGQNVPRRIIRVRMSVEAAALAAIPVDSKPASAPKTSSAPSTSTSRRAPAPRPSSPAARSRARMSANSTRSSSRATT
jgi:hypothetical protein